MSDGARRGIAFRPAKKGLQSTYGRIRASAMRRLENASATDHARALADLQRLARVGALRWDLRTGELEWSAELYRILGLIEGVHRPSLATWRKRVHPDDLAEFDGQIEAMRRSPGTYAATYRIVRPDGKVRTLECHGHLEFDGAGAPCRVVGTAQDISAIALAEERFRSLFQAAPYPQLVLDRSGTIILANAAAERLFGGATGSLRGQAAGKLIPCDTGTPWYLSVDGAGAAAAAPLELQARRASGHEFPVEVRLTPLASEDGMLICAAIRDETERKQAAELLAHRASHDALTGLPNRALFLDRLHHALDRARRSRRPLAVMFLDLDDFKLVNDTRGHEVGDQLLVALTPRLATALRPGDTIARFGGDEFVVLCEELTDETDAQDIAERISSACSGALAIGEREHVVTVSVGVVVVSNPDLATTFRVLRDADAAMYRAKDAGKGQIEIFHEAMRARLMERVAIEGSLRLALDRDEFQLLYQPILSLAQGRVVAVEALLRWRHPRRGVLGPEEFIPIAESSGLIVEIGERVLERACSQAAVWRDAVSCRSRPVRVSVNVSPRQLARGDFPGTVARVLRDTGLEAGLLELELTEEMLTDDGGRSVRALAELNALGVRLVLDDFGTGYSSLSYLRQLTIDALKIDRSFIAGLGHSAADGAIVDAVIGVGAALGLGVTAEGVETPAQLARLRERGCEYAQGFLFSHPAPAEHVSELLAEPGCAEGCWCEASLATRRPPAPAHAPVAAG